MIAQVRMRMLTRTALCLALLAMLSGFVGCALRKGNAPDASATPAVYGWGEFHVSSALPAEALERVAMDTPRKDGRLLAFQSDDVVRWVEVDSMSVITRINSKKLQLDSHVVRTGDDIRRLSEILGDGILSYSGSGSTTFVFGVPQESLQVVATAYEGKISELILERAPRRSRS